MTNRPQVTLRSVTGLTVTARAKRIRIQFDLQDPGDIDLGALMSISVGGSALVTIEGLQATLPLEQSPATAVPADGQIVFVAVNEPTPTYHITRNGSPVCGFEFDPDDSKLKIPEQDADAAGITTLPMCTDCQELWKE